MMKFVTTVAILGLLLGCQGCLGASALGRAARPDLQDLSDVSWRIVHGGDASPFQFPWQTALLTTTNNFFCGGSIIDPSWILTAGHCIDALDEFQVVVGSLKVPTGSKEASSQVFNTTEKYLHPQYDMQFLDNDIGLLKLPVQIKTSLLVKPVRLPSYSMAMEDFTGQTAVVSGWGKTTDESEQASPVLKYTYLSILPNSECQIVYGNTMLGNKLCLSAQDGKSVCQGDSGGALVIKRNGTSENDFVQIGITSFVSIEGCTVKMPQGFTKVALFLEFIGNISGIAIVD